MEVSSETLRVIMDWLVLLPRVKVYPQNKHRFWGSAQCDGCFAILHPMDVQPEWATKHYSHRAEVLEPMLPLDSPDYDSKSMHVREEFIKNNPDRFEDLKYTFGKRNGLVQ